MNISNRNPTRRRIAGIAGVLCAVLILGACASTPNLAPTSTLDAARTAISNAERNDAGHYAGAQLDTARQKLLSAEKAVRDDNMSIAERLAQEARVEAELASARTEAMKAAEVNKELSKGADALADEIKRAGERQ